MKLIRHGAFNEESPGLQLEDGTRIDASAFGEDYNEKFFATDGLRRLEAWARTNAEHALQLPADTRLGSPVARPSKIVCIGLNFSDHAAETGAELPKEPITFFKATTALCGPYDTLIIPRNSEHTDWEVELAFVIGKQARYVKEESALEHIAGYALMNDYSERAWQKERGGQWNKGKSADSFAPLGPFLATPDELSDIDQLKMWLKVNDELRQDGTSANLIFKIPFLLSYLSQFMTLLPGDVISTGTPAGVGAGMNPPQFLKPGDKIELGIESLGSSNQVAVTCPT
ncbi:fumarylacetoacetate hydrolase family protein [Verrucomicrobiales bacterium]|nr:fumarylacetoacetate hydrolase family protein [Verrucomicrobiales bacterium]